MYEVKLGSAFCQTSFSGSEASLLDVLAMVELSSAR